jgi:hypothetical protein
MRITRWIVAGLIAGALAQLHIITVRQAYDVGQLVGMTRCTPGMPERPRDSRG